MAVTRVVPTSGGSTLDPTIAAIARGQVPKAAANSTWMAQVISAYNQPLVSFATPDRIEAAAQSQAEIIRRIQEAQRMRMEAMAAEAQQQQQEEPLSLFGAPMTGPLGGPVSSAARGIGGALSSVGEFLTSEAPNLPISIDPMGNPLTQGSTEKLDGFRRYKGADVPGYMQQPVIGQNGQIVGYKYVKLQEGFEGQIVSGSIPTLNEVNSYTDSGPGGSRRVTSKDVGYISINDEITALENSFSNRRVQAAIDIWGKPEEIENPDKSKSLRWGTNGMSYLGLTPGYVYTPTFNKPAADASYSDLVKYRDRLQGQIRKPLYTPDALNTEFSNMGIEGIKAFQKKALAARLYDTNDVVSFGNVSSKDMEIMKALMSSANINGTTYQDQLDLLIQGAATVDARGGGGGGGGGGGTSVYTQITYNQTSLSQGRSILTAILKNALGRIPTDQELADFISMLNEAESQSPTRTVTRTSKTGDRTRSVARTTPSTVDPEQMALEFVQRIDGGQPYRENKAQMYMNWIAERLGYGFGQG